MKVAMSTYELAMALLALKEIEETPDLANEHPYLSSRELAAQLKRIFYIEKTQAENIVWAWQTLAEVKYFKGMFGESLNMLLNGFLDRNGLVLNRQTNLLFFKDNIYDAEKRKKQALNDGHDPSKRPRRRRR